MCDSQKMSTSLPFPSNEWTQQPSMETTLPKPSAAMVQQKHQEALNCPRCDSTNTKFCYYNNYSLSQPRHFCKACKRYWTRGGTLRNVPVGGGSRKNKRHKVNKNHHPTPAAAPTPVATHASSSLDPSTFFFPGAAAGFGAVVPHYPGIDSEFAQFCANNSDVCFVKDVMGGGGGGGGGGARVNGNIMGINHFDAPFASASASASNVAEVGDLAYSHFWNSMLTSLI